MPVVGLHGLTATHRYVLLGSRWLERNGHDVILYDARGHGSSQPAPLPSAYGYDVMSADLEAMMDAAGIQRAVLVGVSMGAHTLLRFALERPDRAAALVLITPGFNPDSAVEAGRTERWRALADGLRNGGIDGFIAADDLETLPERWRQTVATAVRQRLELHEHLDAVADAIDVVPYSRPFDDWSRLATIAAPALVIGSRDEADPTHPLALARRYAEAIPRAQFAVEEAGASPLAWQGARVSRLIAELGEHA